MPLTAHGVSHPGGRTTNEDAFLVDLDRGLFVVADGMGGHQAGEVASAIAVDAIRQLVCSANTSPSDLLEDAIQAANERVLTTAAGHAGYAGMGTTVAAAMITGEKAVFANVGDSRIYRMHDGELSLLTRDDSWLSCVEPDGGPVGETRHHPMRHVLTKVVGLQRDLEPAIAEAPFAAGDLLLLCSDGLHEVLSKTQLASRLNANRPVADIARDLVAHAIASGATDNVTAVVVRREP